MKKWNLIARFFALLFLLAGCFYAIRDGLLIDWWNPADIWAVSILTAAYFSLIYCHKIVAAAGCVVVMAAEGMLVYQQYGQLENEVRNGINHVIPLVNSYHRKNFSFEETMIADVDSRFFLLAFAVLLGWWISIGVSQSRMRIFAIIPLAAAYGCGFAIGFAPGITAVICLMCGLGISGTVFKRNETKAEWKGSIVVLIGLLAVLGIVGKTYQPIADTLLKRHDELKAYQLSLEDKAIDFIRNQQLLSRLYWGMGLYSETAQLTNEPPGLTNEPVFEITIDALPKDPIYVKNYTGAYYDSGVWSRPSQEAFEQYSAERGIESSEAGKDIMTNGFQCLDSMNMEYQTVTIQILKQTGSMSLLPYLCNIPQDAELVADSGIRMTEENTYQLQGYLRSRAAVYYDLITQQTSQSGDDAYIGYAYQEYLKLPQGQLDRFRNNWKEVIENLEYSCSYSLDLEPVPPGQDPVEYFVFEQQKGYCMHFASAYTLFFRTMDIPARYASGYIVLPADFKENEDGTYTARVLEKRAHAWMEVYNYAVGWTPMEVTGSYYSALLSSDAGASVEDIVAQLAESEEPQQEQQEEEPDTPAEKENPPKTPEEKEPDKPEESTEQDASGEEASTGEPGSGEKILKTLLALLKVILIPAAVLALILLRAILIRMYRNRRFQNADASKAALAVTRETLRLLGLWKIRLKKGGDELAFAKEVQERLAFLEDNLFVEFIEIARMARYGQGQITEGQLRYLLMVYQKLAGSRIKSLKWYRRIWYRYIHVIL